MDDLDPQIIETQPLMISELQSFDLDGVSRDSTDSLYQTHENRHLSQGLKYTYDLSVLQRELEYHKNLASETMKHESKLREQYSGSISLVS